MFGEKVLQKELIGGGDLKIMFMCGIYIGVEMLLYVLFFALLSALPFALILKIKKRIQTLAFVPFLTFSVFVILLPSSIKTYNLPG